MGGLSSPQIPHNAAKGSPNGPIRASDKGISRSLFLRTLVIQLFASTALFLFFYQSEGVSTPPPGPVEEARIKPAADTANSFEFDSPTQNSDSPNAAEANRDPFLVNPPQRTVVPYALRPPADLRGYNLSDHASARRSGRFGKYPRDASSNRVVPQVPIGKGHSVNGPMRYPFWGEDFVDDATAMVLAMDPETPDPNTADKYDRPEDADELARNGSIWHELSTKYKNANVTEMIEAQKDTTTTVTSHPHVVLNPFCLISVVYSQSCAYLDESFEDCVLRVGHKRLRQVLSERCRFSHYWLTIEAKARQGMSIYRKGQSGGRKNGAGEGVNSVPLAFRNTIHPLQMGPVPSSEMCSPNRPDTPFVRAELRDHPPMGPPRQCRDGGLQYPVAFGTPSTNIVKKPLPKLFDFLPIPLDVTNKKKSFAFNDEDTYQALAALSHFCMTHARGGWDCGRHYEVMGAGCVPYFYDIHASPPYILPHFPKKLLMDIVKKPFFKHIGYVKGAVGDTFSVPNGSVHVQNGHFNTRSRVNFVNETFRIDYANGWDKQWYWETARKLLKYTQKYLTAEAMASYVIKTMGIDEENPLTFKKRVLFVTNPLTQWDNLQQTLVTGFAALGYDVAMTANQFHDLYKCFEGGRMRTSDATEGGAAANSSHLSSDPSTFDPVLSSEAMCDLRVKRYRKHVHGAGAPWANRIQNRRLFFLPDVLRAKEWASHDQFDLAIFPYMPAYAALTMDMGLVFSLLESTNGKVAIMDNNDSIEDPRHFSKYLDKHVYYFGRELRDAYC